MMIKNVHIILGLGFGFLFLVYQLSPTVAVWAGLAGLIVFAIYGRQVRAKRTRALEQMVNALRLQFSFTFISRTWMSILCMDQQGENLRVIHFSLDSPELVKTLDVTVPVANIVSVELVTEYVTTSTKQNAVGRAVVGNLLFGGVGAIVGSTSSGSVAEKIIKPGSASELVFELSDVANPVVRFWSIDHAECELWLHRVRSAMANKRDQLIKRASV